MMKQMMHSCCGPDGKPDFDKMAAFVEQQDRSSVFDVIGWALFFIWVGFAWLMGIGLGYGLLGVWIANSFYRVGQALNCGSRSYRWSAFPVRTIVPAR